MRFLLSYFKFAAFSSRSIFSVIVSEYRHRSVKPSWCFDKELWHMAHMNTLAHRHGELLSLSVSAKAVHPPTPPWQWMSYCWCSVCVCVCLVRPSLVGVHAAGLSSADGCCRIPVLCAPPPGCVPLQMCQISSSVLLCPPDAHKHTHASTADAPLRFLDAQHSAKVARHP